MLKLTEIKKRFLDASSDKSNLNNFKELVPYFLYDDESISRVVEVVGQRQEIDELLKLNKEKRKFFEIKGFESIDESWLKFQRTICNLSFDDFENLPDAIHNYKTFKSGKLPSGQKLFKYLLRKKLLTPKQVEEITTSKTNGTYFCISRNPIDFLFCSTNQSFSSCLSLKSDCSYYLGLPATVLDPNRYMIFLFNGRFKSYTVKSLEFKHFRYISRSWCIMGKKRNGHIGSEIVNPYPDSRVNLDSILKASGNSIGMIKGLDSFKLPRIQNGDRSFIYVDNIGLSGTHTDEAYYEPDSRNSRIGCDAEYEYYNGLEGLKKIEQLGGGRLCNI